jgi:predicted nucleic acid-binding protein
MGGESGREGNFVDSNIFLYVIQAHPQFGKVSKEILKRIDKGERTVTSLINLAEICWWLERHGKKDQIEDELKLITSILNLEIAPLTPEDFLLAGRFVKEYGIDFNDCLVLAAMKRLEIKGIYSNDPDFDKVEWVKREFG